MTHTPPDWMTEYQDFKTLCSAVNGQYIRFYLTTGRDGIAYTHSQLEAGSDLPRYSCRLTAGDGAELTLTLEEWRGRADEAREAVRDWIRAHVTLRGCKLEASRYQGDPYWKAQLHQDNA